MFLTSQKQELTTAECFFKLFYIKVNTSQETSLIRLFNVSELISHLLSNERGHLTGPQPTVCRTHQVLGSHGVRTSQQNHLQALMESRGLTFLSAHYFPIQERHH